jgi:diphthamide biosynthesis methyltransferase
MYSYHISKEKIESLKKSKKVFLKLYTAIKLQKSESPFSKVCLYGMNS